MISVSWVHAGHSVADAAEAYRVSIEHGALPVLPPTLLTDAATGTSQLVAEIRITPASDAVLRYVSGTFAGPFMPNFAPVGDASARGSAGYGLKRIDHMGLCVTDERKVIGYLAQATGALRFAVT
jgi:4-hydroxyphenylpyruvate dioxygenase